MMYSKQWMGFLTNSRFNQMRRSWVLQVPHLVFIHFTPSAAGADCSRHFGDIHWLLQLDDNDGSCWMEKAPLDGEYPPDSIPFNLRNGRELCTRRGSDADPEYQWRQGKRVSGIFYGSRDVTRDSDAIIKLDFRDSSVPAGPAKVFLDDRLLCEFPVTASGKVTGIVKEYGTNGKVVWQARLQDGKEAGGSVKYDERGQLVSLSCEEKPVFDGDLNGRPATVEVTGGGRARRILTHLNGRLTAEETFSRHGEREVKRYHDGGRQSLQVEKYYKNGKIRQRYTEKKDKLHGKYEEYFENGGRAEEGPVEEGRIVEIKRYYMDGAQKVVAEVAPDFSLCAVLMFDSDGKVQVEGTFKSKRGGVAWDIPQGRVRNYDEDGAVAREKSRGPFRGG